MKRWAERERERNYPIFHLKHSFLELVVVGKRKEFHMLHVEVEMNAKYYIIYYSRRYYGY